MLAVSHSFNQNITAAKNRLVRHGSVTRETLSYQLTDIYHVPRQRYSLPASQPLSVRRSSQCASQGPQKTQQKPSLTDASAVQGTVCPYGFQLGDV